MKQIMVLSDGQTFSGLYGCHIVEVPDEYDIDEIEEALSEMAKDVAVDTSDGVRIITIFQEP